MTFLLKKKKRLVNFTLVKFWGTINITLLLFSEFDSIFSKYQGVAHINVVHRIYQDLHCVDSVFILCYCMFCIESLFREFFCLFIVIIQLKLSYKSLFHLFLKKLVRFSKSETVIK